LRTALKTISNTGIALITRPAQIIFFEIGPVASTNSLRDTPTCVPS
jgi:hypothetical protein